MLDSSTRILSIIPSYTLSPFRLAERALNSKKIAHARLTACTAAGIAIPQADSELIARWEQLPDRLTIPLLEQQPDVEENVIDLIYDTETVTAQSCGAPTGDDALLLLIARDPAAVEQR
jgi:hypothetical protein